MDRYLKVAMREVISKRSPARLLPLLVVSLFASGGCAAMTNPVADGVRVRHLAPELLTPSKACDETIPLNLLRQPPNKTYKLGAGDVLGVYVEGFLGDRNVALPLHINPPVQAKDQRRLAPSSGYPVTVQENGTISLPSVSPLKVSGLSLEEAREAIRNQYLAKKLIQPENDRIFVTLMQARQYQVLVFRQEAGGFATNGIDGIITTTKRGTGHLVDLPANENDVLHALALTGGLPGLDAYNEVIIERGGFRDKAEREAIEKQIKNLPPGASPLQIANLGKQTIRIPLRQQPGAPLCFGPEDIILETGDVVFLEAREDQWFYTGGLLPPGRHLLPRDIDLDVIEAVAQVRGPLFNGAFGGSNLSGDLLKPGIGNPSPTLLTVLRRTPSGGQVPIRVDLARALNEPQERIRLQAGDVLILQEKPGDAFARYFTQTFMNFDLVWQVFRTSNATGILDVSAVDRLPGRQSQVQIIPPR